HLADCIHRLHAQDSGHFRNAPPRILRLCFALKEQDLVPASLRFSYDNVGILLQLLANARITQAFLQGALPAFRNPRRQNGTEVRDAVIPSMHIASDVQASSPCLLHLSHGLLHRPASVVLQSGDDADMRNLQWYASVFARPQRFLHGLPALPELIASVSGIDPAGAADHAAEFGDLLFCRSSFRSVFEAGRETQRALLQTL